MPNGEREEIEVTRITGDWFKIMFILCLVRIQLSVVLRLSFAAVIFPCAWLTGHGRSTYPLSLFSSSVAVIMAGRISRERRREGKYPLSLQLICGDHNGW